VINANKGDRCAWLASGAATEAKVGRVREEKDGKQWQHAPWDISSRKPVSAGNRGVPLPDNVKRAHRSAEDTEFWLAGMVPVSLAGLED